MNRSVRITEINNFEISSGVSVCVFIFDQGYVKPIYVTENKFRRHVNLLMLTGKQNGKDVHHFITISRLGSFVGKSKYRKAHLCPWCFGKFHKGLDKHKKTCQVFNMKSITLPKDRYFEFKNFKMYMQVYFKMFFRFLYLDSNVASGSTDMQIIAGYCIVIIDPDNKIFDQTSYVGDRAMELFLQTFRQKSEELHCLVKATCVN
jgi:hypothetical protein